MNAISIVVFAVCVVGIAALMADIRRRDRRDAERDRWHTRPPS